MKIKKWLVGHAVNEVLSEVEMRQIWEGLQDGERRPGHMEFLVAQEWVTLAKARAELLRRFLDGRIGFDVKGENPSDIRIAYEGTVGERPYRADPRPMPVPTPSGKVELLKVEPLSHAGWRSVVPQGNQARMDSTLLNTIYRLLGTDNPITVEKRIRRWLAEADPTEAQGPGVELHPYTGMQALHKLLGVQNQMQAIVRVHRLEKIEGWWTEIACLFPGKTEQAIVDEVKQSLRDLGELGRPPLEGLNLQSLEQACSDRHTVELAQEARHHRIQVEQHTEIVRELTNLMAAMSRGIRKEQAELKTELKAWVDTGLAALMSQLQAHFRSENEPAESILDPIEICEVDGCEATATRYRPEGLEKRDKTRCYDHRHFHPLVEALARHAQCECAANCPDTPVGKVNGVWCCLRHSSGHVRDGATP